jgi:hypothetical protein
MSVPLGTKESAWAFLENGDLLDTEESIQSINRLSRSSSADFSTSSEELFSNIGTENY